MKTCSGARRVCILGKLVHERWLERSMHVWNQAPGLLILMSLCNENSRPQMSTGWPDLADDLQIKKQDRNSSAPILAASLVSGMQRESAADSAEKGGWLEVCPVRVVDARADGFAAVERRTGLGQVRRRAGVGGVGRRRCWL